ncbi:phosphocholine cytidylyltransferase family protein [Rickettsiales endosymbiont of Stachyamoeba lipophora]|uniref:phosphocholine cytidylyltransferase family protein n=1 Tax=Rickettsiales endosymbiont of Stachyamoeba lipophora TaxID=2486578 RepID=UPI000F646936|nr:phosphocholine cytidylyltransferase family protein [Rickettsiales endosymbiont of Stachyamoeba lipophora]AZL16262.1 phosphocholine cytidylyltransferase family protein [Rickettsiales endosymbiont of Stachyamoeba lipophora]
MKENIRFVMLAAGRGSRLENITDNHPKCMTEIGDKSLIKSQLEVIKNFSNQVAVVTGYLAHVLEDHLSGDNINFFHSNNWQQSNMVSSLLCAQSWFKDSTVIVCYTDILYSKDAIEKLIATKGDIVIPYYTKWKELWSNRFTNPLDDLESFKITADQNLIEIGKKASSLQDIEGQFMGIMKFTAQGWNQCIDLLNKLDNKEIAKLDSTKLLNRLIIEEQPIKTIAINDFWLEIDSKNDYALYKDIVLS